MVPPGPGRIADDGDVERITRGALRAQGKRAVGAQSADLAVDREVRRGTELGGEQVDRQPGVHRGYRDRRLERRAVIGPVRELNAGVKERQHLRRIQGRLTDVRYCLVTRGANASEGASGQRRERCR